MYNKSFHFPVEILDFVSSMALENRTGEIQGNRKG